MSGLLRWALWRAMFAIAGGLTVRGSLPRGGCVIVARHVSHADAPLLLAALGRARRVRVAAAADYWTGWRGLVCRSLVGGARIRRSGGGSADLEALVPWLCAGGVVVVFPEGTRSRDGSVADFRGGAGRLAAAAGVPLVPVGIGGTSAMLPPHGRPRRVPTVVAVGESLDASTTPAEQRAAVLALAPAFTPASSRLASRMAALALSPRGPLLVAAWAFAEALSWPLVPELAVCLLVLAAPRAGVRLSVAAAVGSVIGGVLAWQLAVADVAVPAPLTTPRMHAVASGQLASQGAAALEHQPWSGIPYKVYAAAAGSTRVPVGGFVAQSALHRGGRILGVGLVMTALAALLSRWRRCYAVWVVGVVGVFAISLAQVVASWS